MQTPPTSHLRPPIGSLVQVHGLTLPFLLLLLLFIVVLLLGFHLFWPLLQKKNKTIKSQVCSHSQVVRKKVLEAPSRRHQETETTAGHVLEDTSHQTSNNNVCVCGLLGLHLAGWESGCSRLPGLPRGVHDNQVTQVTSDSRSNHAPCWGEGDTTTADLHAGSRLHRVHITTTCMFPTCARSQPHGPGSAGELTWSMFSWLYGSSSSTPLFWPAATSS